MEKFRVLFVSDLHLCHKEWYGVSTGERMKNLVRDLNRVCEETPCEKIVFLGDYSLDHWQWSVGGSWLREGLSNTSRFVREYAGELKVPYVMLPGNHEQYGHETWRELTGSFRAGSFTAGGYLFVACDTFSGVLDPDFHSDGEYVPVDLAFVKNQLEQVPELPVILCSHYFDLEKEPEEFFAFLREEKRILFLICGHEHVNKVADLGERGGGASLYYNGHYSYARLDKTPREMMWGFSVADLSEDGAELRYVEPENTLFLEEKPYHHSCRQQNVRFFRRRDR